MQPLVLLLDSESGRQLFTAASAMMRSGYISFSLYGHLLQATLAFLWAIGKNVPEEALGYFEGCKYGMQTRGLPLSFALPQQDNYVDVVKGKMGSRRTDSVS